MTSVACTNQSVSRFDSAAYRHHRDIMSHGIDITSNSSSSSAEHDDDSLRCFPLPLTTHPLSLGRDVTVTSLGPRARGGASATPPPPRPRPQRMSRALTIRWQFVPTSDDVMIGDVTRRDVMWRALSVSWIASSIGNVRADGSSMMLSYQSRMQSGVDTLSTYGRTDGRTDRHWPAPGERQARSCTVRINAARVAITERGTAGTGQRRTAAKQMTMSHESTQLYAATPPPPHANRFVQLPHPSQQQQQQANTMTTSETRARDGGQFAMTHASKQQCNC